MSPLFLYNTLSLRKEEFKPLVKDEVGLYTCGPTVYNYAHIGNLRTYLFEDFLVRVLEYNGYDVKHITNITDVGHLTGDMDMGEDKMEKGAAREGKSAWDIAEFYTVSFKKNLADLNIKEPNAWCKATDYIKEQIAMIKTLEDKGFTYQTSDGIYFDTSKIKDYNKLSHLPLEQLKEGARIEINPEKKNPTDFALWKFSPALKVGEAKRQMEWDSPWGIGFPGWHIECSAMSLALLKDQLDIHCGGIDHINVHHTNEIAQSEAATGKKFFNYWMHGAFLNIAGGKKMAKSEDNFLTLDNALVKKGINPLAYRFAALQTHYRKPMEYSEEVIDNSRLGWDHLYNQVQSLGEYDKYEKIWKWIPGQIDKNFKELFLAAVNDDLNTPQALAVVQDMLKSDLNNHDKLATILDFDKVLGLELKPTEIVVKDDIQKLVTAREIARSEKNWVEADRLRVELEARGYLIEDVKDGYKVKKK